MARQSACHVRRRNQMHDRTIDAFIIVLFAYVLFRTFFWSGEADLGESLRRFGWYCLVALLVCVMFF